MNDNKKAERLFTTLSEADDRYVAEAAEAKPKKKWFLSKKFIATAAALVCVVGIGATVAVIANNSGYPIKYIHVDNTKVEQSTAYIKKWDEKTISEKYIEFKTTDDELFISYNKKLDNTLIDLKLSDVTVSGYDVYTEKTYTSAGTTYKIKDISEHYAVAVQFPDDDSYYLYVVNLYNPATIGDMVDALNLKENLSFNKITYREITNGKSFDEVTFEGEFADKVWEYLLSAREVPMTVAENDHFLIFPENSRQMSIGINIDVIGLNIGMTVRDDGILQTNLLSSGKYFDIGKEKANEFMDYVKKNLDGYIIKYVYEEPPKSPDNNNVSSSVESKVETTWMSSAAKPEIITEN